MADAISDGRRAEARHVGPCYTGPMQKCGLVAFAAAVWLGALFAQPASAEACGCMLSLGYGDPAVDLRTTESQYSRAFAVFVGRVTAVGGGQAMLELQRTWKGPAGPTLAIQVGSRGPHGYFSGLPVMVDTLVPLYTHTSCDPSFKVGETYLVYAYGNSAAELRSDNCDGTRLLQYAAQEVLNLDYVVKQASDGATGTPGPVAR